MNVCYLGSYSVEGNLPSCGGQILKWSKDNQIALVHKKAIQVYECRQTPADRKRSPKLAIFSSRLDLPEHLPVPDTGDVSQSDVVKDQEKQHVFDLMRDQILRPHGYENVLMQNYFNKAAWSPLPVYRGLEVETRCILATLTANHQLLIYGRRNRQILSDTWIEPWEMLVDVSALYNKYMLEAWTSEDKREETPFHTYKRRLYELAITDFVWIQDWKLDPEECNNPDEGKGVFSSYFMTFHASGDACIWKMKLTKTVIPQYVTRVVYKKEYLIEENDTVSCAEYLYVCPDYGLLFIGTNKGKLYSLFIQKLRTAIKGGGRYFIDKRQCLWEEDMIGIEHILVYPTSSDNKSMDIVVVKNPNIVIATSIEIVGNTRLTGEDFSIVKVPFGAIVGISLKREGEFILSHTPGKLSVLNFKEGELECQDELVTSIFDPRRHLKEKDIALGGLVLKENKRKTRRKVQIKDSDKRLLFRGLAISPNNVILCVARTAGVYHDHLKLRKPIQIVFYSLFPEEGLFSSVLDVYRENEYSLRGITDALVVLRRCLKGASGESLFSQILEWADPLNHKSIGELQLLLWCLRCAPNVDPDEWEVATAEQMFNPDAMKKLTGIETLRKYRIDLVIDRIMQKRCKSLVTAVLSQPDVNEFSLDNERNQQSIKVVSQYLKSKGGNDEVEIPPLAAEPPVPCCYWCKGPIEFPLEEDATDELLKDVDRNTDFDKEELSGFKWNARRHPVKQSGIHRPEICILSLLPLGFPYRRCRNCYVPALMEPTFGQMPYCPLCNARMFPNQGIIEETPSTGGEPSEISSIDELVEAEMDEEMEEEISSESEYISDSSE